MIGMAAAAALGDNFKVAILDKKLGGRIFISGEAAGLQASR